jgi:hypothetical protein
LQTAMTIGSWFPWLIVLASIIYDRVLLNTLSALDEGCYLVIKNLSVALVRDREDDVAKTPILNISVVGTAQHLRFLQRESHRSVTIGTGTSRK